MTVASRFLLSHPVLEARMESLGRSLEIPSLPDLYLKVRSIIDSPNSSAVRVAALLASEPGLSLKILRVANSAAYGLRQQLTRVEQAIALLGMQEISSIVLSATLLRNSPDLSGQPLLDLQKFWEHSIGTAIMARILGYAADPSAKINLHDAFLAGLVHDIGKLVMLQNFAEEAAQVLDLCRRENITMLQAENTVFGFSHQDVGAYVADQWGFERHIVKALELHNSPDDLDTGDESYPFTCLIHVADLFAHVLRFGDSGDALIPVISGRAFDALAIDLKAVPVILEQGRSSFSDARELLG